MSTFNILLFKGNQGEQKWCLPWGQAETEILTLVTESRIMLTMTQTVQSSVGTNCLIPGRQHMQITLDRAAFFLCRNKQNEKDAKVEQ